MTNISNKAWIVDLSRIDEGYCCGVDIFYSESRGKAKTHFLNEFDGAQLIDGEDISFLNIPVVRSKRDDLVQYNGEWIHPVQVDRRENVRKRNMKLDSILEDGKISHCYIVKRGNYYASGYAGYVTQACFAGVYPKHDAVSHAKRCEDIKLISINNENHNEMIMERINLLKSKIIK